MDTRGFRSDPNGREATPEGDTAERVVAVDERDAHKFDWGSIQWLCSGQIYPDAQQTFGVVQILPGQKNPRHHHPNSDEVLLLLEGELEHSLGDASYRLTPGMAIHIPQGIEHDARNCSDVIAHMVVAYPTSDRRVVTSEEGQE